MRKFKIPTTLIATTTENKPPVTEPKCFRVMYSKDVKKKKKLYEDGVIYHDGDVFKLFDMYNFQLYSGNHKVIPENGFGQFCYEILNQVPAEDFKTGKVFYPLPQVNKMPFRRQKTEEVVAPVAPVAPAVNVQDEKKLISIGLIFFLEKFIHDVMRPHQIEGLKFMLDCITDERRKGYNGCILADTMGLGKSLQAITLIWVSITQIGLRKAVIVAPTTLLQNWGNEIKKWLGTRLSFLTVNRSQEEPRKTLYYFRSGKEYKVLIISYETLRDYSKEINESCDLLICDEGHRLKNADIKTVENISKLSCSRRVILTGTPIQNNLKEFYTCINFVNPGILSTYKHFKGIYEYYIYAIERPDASRSDKAVGEQRALELQEKTKWFILRRTQEILQKMIPPKYEYLIFNTMSENQQYLYRLLLSQKDYQSMEVINLLRKVITHPNLIIFDDNKAYQFLRDQLTDKSSDKFQMIKIIVEDCIKKDDRIVIASQYCQTLDQVECLMSQMGVRFVRLNGKTAQNARQQIVDQFNKYPDDPVFLLNSKSGGTGLNIIGANRMICIDIDWNPANDLQLMGRIWRDGQKKSVHIYRLISCGTYEEKILQRQFNKDNLSKSIIDEQFGKRKSFNNDLAELFEFNGNDKCMLYKDDNDIKDVVTNDIYQYPKELEKYTVLVKVKKDVLKQDNEFNDKTIFTSSKKIKKSEEKVPELKQLYNKRSLVQKIQEQVDIEALALEWDTKFSLEDDQKLTEEQKEERRKQKLIDEDFQRRLDAIINDGEDEQNNQNESQQFSQKSSQESNWESNQVSNQSNQDSNSQTHNQE